MLKSLTVTNFALIEQITVEFADGLNILTGETGAGKSILIDALSTILGSRASVDSIRTGCEFFRVEAIFHITKQHPLWTLLEEQNISLEDDTTLIMSRKLSRHGKNNILLNGCTIPLGILRQIGEKLVDMHGQHENQTLLHPETYLTLLDSFDVVMQDKLEQYRAIYLNWIQARNELSSMEGRSRECAQRLDMLVWQTQEIAAATLKLNEEEELQHTICLLDNAEKIITAVNRAYVLLNQNGNEAVGLLSGLAEAKHHLDIATRYDPRLQTQLVALTDALYQLEESSMELRDYAENTEFDPNLLASLQERMNLIYNLKKKYGATITDILDYYEKAQLELADIETYDQRLTELKRKFDQLEVKLTTAADELSTLRQRSSQQLASQVSHHLTELGMPKAVFITQVTSTEHFTPQGRNEVILLFSANPGEEPKILHKIASGGELSRIALAIKTVCAHRDYVSTMVFDEIDAGIGGQTAQKVAEKIAMLASVKQVLCITHLPQIACMADSHIYIEKHVDGQRTNTVVRTLDQPELLVELTRMTSGSDITQVAVDNAKQMIHSAQQKKKKWKTEK